MTSQDESDGRQKTVAELLAQHGSGQTVGAPRRRRRRAEDASEETAPQAIIERVRSDTGQFPPVPSPSGGHRAGDAPRQPVASPQQAAPPHPARQEPAAPPKQTAQPQPGASTA
ncbi:MAG: hypothetical protein ACRDRN_22470, partial [Sciscionella sp.]